MVQELAAGPKRGLGRVNAMTENSLLTPEGMSELVAALRDDRTVVALRAAAALKKLQKVRPELLLPHARAILRSASDAADVRTRWNLTITVSRLPLRGSQRALAIELMWEALRSENSFLRTFGMQGLVNFAAGNEALRKRVLAVVCDALENGSPAMRARAGKLLPRVSESAAKQQNGNPRNLRDSC